MRVALVAMNAPARNAIGNLVAEKVLFFRERGAEVRVFLESLDELHPAIGQAESLERIERTGSAWNFLREADLVWFEYSQSFALLDALPMLVGERPRLIASYYGVSPAEGWPGPQRELLDQGYRDRGLLACADAVFVHSAFTREELAPRRREVPSRGGGREAPNIADLPIVPAERVHRLDIPLDLQQWRPGPPRSPGRSLLFVGRLAPNKRLDLAIRALARLPGATLDVVGDDRDVYAEQARRARSLADALGVADRIRWHGLISDDALLGLLQTSDLLVQPSIHEGFGIPVRQAQAVGLPVVAARAAALPETVGDAGLTFAPDDLDDLVEQIRRVLDPGPCVSRASHASHASHGEGLDGALPESARRRIAIAAFRFAPDIVGGAERSLRVIAHALVAAGCQVEIFTTCTRREHDWRDDFPAGDSVEEGLLVHRYPITPTNHARHLDANRAIIDTAGRVAPETEHDFFAHSIRSAALLDVLTRRVEEFDVILCGPYLHGLAFDVARAFPEKAFVLPCFHDEPQAYLRSVLAVYRGVAGIFYHSPEEQAFAHRLGLNHPGATVIGTLLPGLAIEPKPLASPGPRTLVYSGRYSTEKNVPLLLEFATRYERERPGRFRWTFIGEGAVEIPRGSWIENHGRVSEAEKQAVLASADALVQLSTRESLSLVVLEAWRLATPVIVHSQADVLRGQLERSGGGVDIGDYESFARALDELWTHPGPWRERGQRGRAYVETAYGDATAFQLRLLAALDERTTPLAQRLRRRGWERAVLSDRDRWRESLDQRLETILDQAPRRPTWNLVVETFEPRIAVGSATSLLLPVRVYNRGDVPAPGRGPAGIRLRAEIRSEAGVRSSSEIRLFDLILPGRDAVVTVPLEVSQLMEPSQLSMKAIRSGGEVCGPVTTVPLVPNGSPSEVVAREGVAPLLDAARRALLEARRERELPTSYVDVTQGRFARVKAWIKRTLLNNFKRGYVDVMSRQQSEVNRQLIDAVARLSDCCQALDQTVRRLEARLAETEARNDALESPAADIAPPR